MYFSIIRIPKGTSLCQNASFEPSAINIGSGIRPVDVRMEEGDGNKGWKHEKMDNALKMDRSVIFHACAEP